MSNALGQYVNEQRRGKVVSPQTERTPGRTDEVKNNAGGYVHAVSDQQRLERFLILGTDGATYYVNAKDQTEAAVDFLKKVIAEDEHNVINTIVDVSDNGRAYKNSPALFALAMVYAVGQDKDYLRKSGAFGKVVRTSTHLFEFTNYLKGLGGIGSAKKKALASFYTSRSDNDLAYQVVKYRSRSV